MKFLRNKSILFKLIVAFCILFVFLENGCNINVVQADATDMAGEAAMQGGKLLTPVFDLLMTFGDGVMHILQKAITGTDSEITLNFVQSLFGIVIGILAAVAAIVALIVLTGGIGAIVGAIGGALGSILTAIGTSGVVSTVLTIAIAGSALGAYHFATTAFAAKYIPDITVFPTYSIGPEEIFEGNLLVFDINFFNPKQVKVHLKETNTDKNVQDYKEDTDGEAEYYFYEDSDAPEGKVITSKQDLAMDLSATISKWYYAIRNIAIVIMMLVLIYIGIRMMLCSIASEKSKYKKMLGDWVVSMCLVFVLQYIMVFAVTINENIVKLVKNSTDNKNYAIALADVRNKDNFVETVEKDETLKKGLLDAEQNSLYDQDGNRVDGTGEAESFVWPTNMVGRIRMMAQMQDGTSGYIGYCIAFLVLVFYTVFFAFTYIKRVIYMAFLTVIAPLVAMTYSIDKIADGKAQAFNMWLREYMFNLLIQPVHLLLYMLLIGMSFDLAANNIIYTLVAMGFMMPAEKLIRSMFGFDKAKTPGFLGGAAGAALTMSGLQKLNKFAGRGPGGKDAGREKAAKLKMNENDSKGIYDRSADSGKGFNELLSGNEERNDNNNSSNNVSGGSSATDANLNLNDSEDPVRKMERENLEEQIAEGLLDKENLSDSQKELLGIRTKDELDEEDEEDELEQKDSNPRGLQKLQKWGNNTKNNAKGRLDAFKRIGRDNFGREFASKEAWKNKIKTATATTLKGGTRLTGAVLGAGIGAAAGIATGDVQSVMKNTAVGVVAGESIGTGLVKRVDDFGSKYQAAKTEYEKDRYGDQYSKIKKAKQDEKFIKDAEARRHFSREFSTELSQYKGKEKKEKLDQIMKQAVEYRQHGVTDNALITKAMKLDKDNKTSNTSIAAAMIANKSKDLDGIAKYEQQLSKQVGANKANIIAKNAAKIGGLSLN